jgi:uncharacterized RDD family membrane protein YckC
MFEMLIRRGFAFLIDLILLMLIFYGNAQVVLLSFSETGQVLGIQVVAVMIVLQFIYVGLYFIYIPLHLSGQTVGKRIMKIKEVKKNGKEMTASDYFRRDFLLKFLLSSMSSGFIVIFNGILLTYQTIRKQPLCSLQDYVMKTDVIKVEN